MPIRARHLAWLTALSLAACGDDSPANERDASMSRDMSTASQDGSLDDGATPRDGALADAELPADMSRDLGADAASSGCTSDEMCADPIRERCNTSTGACEGRPQWAITTIQYEDDPARMLSNLHFDGATVFGTGAALLTFQQGDGSTVWSFELPGGTVAGVHDIEPLTENRITLTVNESSSSVRSERRGYWDAVDGSITLTTCDLRAGGLVRGSLHATIARDGSSPMTGTLQAEFQAEFPD